MREEFAGDPVIYIGWVCPRECGGLIWHQHIGVVWIILLMVLNAYELRMVLDLVSRELWRLLAECDEQNLVFILELLVDKQVFGFHQISLVPIYYGHSSNLI